MIFLVLCASSLALAALPAVMSLFNLPRFRRLPPAARRGADDEAPRGRLLSVLLPARNEAERIGPTLAALRASQERALDIVVMDDASEDATPQIVRAAAERDPRIRLEQAPPLPEGWNGKQHACQALSEVARGDDLLFLDADVRLAPDALPRVHAFLEPGKPALVSGFPRQETGSFLERLLLPLIQFVLLGFLPFPRMQKTTKPSYGAGCGQLMLARREAYEQAGGHAAIRASRHDGLQLPRALRRAGHGTDVFDATDLATCRMYENGREVWNGLAKNATEGMAAPGAIVPWTLLLLGGQVLPFVLLALGLAVGAGTTPLLLAGAAVVLVYATRALMAARFHHALSSVLLHPLGVLLLVGIQWFALVRTLRGRSIPWKGR